jgi:hypothetical protein
VSHGFHARLDLLARHGLDGRERDPGAWAGSPTELPPIHRASTPDAVRSVVAAGADVEARHDGRSALHQAAFMDDVELVRALLGAGADPEARDDTHRTRPLEWARWARAREAEQVLEPVTTTYG